MTSVGFSLLYVVVAMCDSKSRWPSNFEFTTGRYVMANCISYVYQYVCVCICVYIYIYIYTHINTHILILFAPI